jgi:hypothetical protein
MYIKVKSRNSRRKTGLIIRLMRPGFRLLFPSLK